MLSIFSYTIWILKFLFATSIAFAIATVLEFFIHYQFLSWLFVFCLCFYLIFYIIKNLKESVFCISVAVTIVLFFALYYYVGIASDM